MSRRGDADAPALPAHYFDGHQARARPVLLRLVDGELRIEDAGITRRLPARRVRWPERLRHGQRQATLPDGGLLSSDDGAAWDAWWQASGRREAAVVRWQQSWRLTLLAAALLLATVYAAWRWGTAGVAHLLLAVTPAAVDARLGEAALAQLDHHLLSPSRLPAPQQAALQAHFAQAVQRAQAAGLDVPATWSLAFRAAPAQGLGANALALPGGRLVVTDALVELLADRPDVLMGVLGHELGHARHRHGMRLLAQGALLGLLGSAVLGDASGLLAGAPVLLGQLAYAREAELEADDDAATLMRANGWAPADLGLLFERLRAQAPPGASAASTLPIALSTHPPDAERLRRLRRAGGAGAP